MGIPKRWVEATTRDGKSDLMFLSFTNAIAPLTSKLSFILAFMRSLAGAQSGKKALR